MYSKIIHSSVLDCAEASRYTFRDRKDYFNDSHVHAVTVKAVGLTLQLYLLSETERQFIVH